MKSEIIIKFFEIFKLELQPKELKWKMNIEREEISDKIDVFLNIVKVKRYETNPSSDKQKCLGKRKKKKRVKKH